uniref:BAT2_N domain-containing protein n=1 Tax=Rhabditophanes sp. KR3021 TaxID=114890 RepID=A0AC35TKY2_9BILA
MSFSSRGASGGGNRPNNRLSSGGQSYAGKGNASSRVAASGHSKIGGIQSLSKGNAVVRRMPPIATLPSLRSECHGQDSNAAIVPSGGVGWNKPASATIVATPPTKSTFSSTIFSSNDPPLCGSKSVNAENGSDLRPKWAKSNTSSTTNIQEPPPAEYNEQADDGKSPKEFPSLSAAVRKGDSKVLPTAPAASTHSGGYISSHVRHNVLQRNLPNRYRAAPISSVTKSTPFDLNKKLEEVKNQEVVDGVERRNSDTTEAAKEEEYSNDEGLNMKTMNDNFAQYDQSQNHQESYETESYQARGNDYGYNNYEYQQQPKYSTSRFEPNNQRPRYQGYQGVPQPLMSIDTSSVSQQQKQLSLDYGDNNSYNTEGGQRSKKNSYSEHRSDYGFNNFNNSNNSRSRTNSNVGSQSSTKCESRNVRIMKRGEDFPNENCSDVAEVELVPIDTVIPNSISLKQHPGDRYNTNQEEDGVKKTLQNYDGQKTKSENNSNKQNSSPGAVNIWKKRAEQREMAEREMQRHYTSINDAEQHQYDNGAGNNYNNRSSYGNNQYDESYGPKHSNWKGNKGGERKRYEAGPRKNDNFTPPPVEKLYRNNRGVEDNFSNMGNFATENNYYSNDYRKEQRNSSTPEESGKNRFKKPSTRGAFVPRGNFGSRGKDRRPVRPYREGEHVNEKWETASESSGVQHNEKSFGHNEKDFGQAEKECGSEFVQDERFSAKNDEENKKVFPKPRFSKFEKREELEGSEQQQTSSKNVRPASQDVTGMKKKVPTNQKNHPRDFQQSKMNKFKSSKGFESGAADRLADNGSSETTDAEGVGTEENGFEPVLSKKARKAKQAKIDAEEAKKKKDKNKTNRSFTNSDYTSTQKSSFKESSLETQDGKKEDPHLQTSVPAPWSKGDSFTEPSPAIPTEQKTAANIDHSGVKKSPLEDVQKNPFDFEQFANLWSIGGDKDENSVPLMNSIAQNKPHDLPKNNSVDVVHENIMINDTSNNGHELFGLNHNSLIMASDPFGKQFQSQYNNATFATNNFGQNNSMYYQPKPNVQWSNATTPINNYSSNADFFSAFSAPLNNRPYQNNSQTANLGYGQPQHTPIKAPKPSQFQQQPFNLPYVQMPPPQNQVYAPPPPEFFRNQPPPPNMHYQQMQGASPEIQSNGHNFVSNQPIYPANSNIHYNGAYSPMPNIRNAHHLKGSNMDDSWNNFQQQPPKNQPGTNAHFQNNYGGAMYDTSQQMFNMPVNNQFTPSPNKAGGISSPSQTHNYHNSKGAGSNNNTTRPTPNASNGRWSNMNGGGYTTTKQN